MLTEMNQDLYEYDCIATTVDNIIIKYSDKR